MAEHYDDSKFNLRQDWYWSKVIGKRDELQYMDNEAEMTDVLLEYLEKDDLANLTQEDFDALQELDRYLSTSYEEGGMGYQQEYSAHYYALSYLIMNWQDQWDDGSWKDNYGPWDD